MVLPWAWQVLMSCLWGVRRVKGERGEWWRGCSLDLGAAEELCSGKDITSVSCAGKVEQGGIFDVVEECQWDDIYVGVC